MLCRSPNPSMPKPTACLFHTQAYIVHRCTVSLYFLCGPTQAAKLETWKSAFSFQHLHSHPGPCVPGCPNHLFSPAHPCVVHFYFCTWCFLARISFFLFFFFCLLLTYHPSRCLFLLKSLYVRHKSIWYRSTILSETAQPLAPTQRTVIWPVL